ncbi:MAG: AMP-binding protein [Gammaproteobacteria bacterium]
MEKVWLKSYPPGVPAAIDTAGPRTLLDIVDAACAEFAGRPAFANFGSSLSFGDVDDLSRAFAAYLVGVAGLLPGERVALMMPNMLAYPVAMLGALRAGAVVVNTNPQYTPRELAHQLRDSGARIIVVFEGALATLAEVLDEFPGLRVVVARIGDFMPWPKGAMVNRLARRRYEAPVPDIGPLMMLPDAVELGRRGTLTHPAIGADDLAFLQYTGGTTGRAKGAMLSHGNIVANILQVNAWFGDATERGHEVIVTALPLYHVYALTANCLAFMSQGGLNYLITDPRNLRTFIKEIKRVPFTTMTGVNTLFNALVQHPDFAGVDFDHLKFTSGGGMAVQRAVAEQWQAITGSVIAEGYGLTESSPVVTINRFDVTEFTGCIGLPVPSTEVRLLGPDGTPVGVDEPGELCVRGPQVMQGYWNNPEETARVLDADGWLSTGDIAVMRDDGYFSIVDRKKDLIVVSGFNVYPGELEDIAVAHPGVSEAAAIGIPDDRSGETVRLVVVASDPGLDAAALEAWFRERVTGYKVPRSIVFADELPKSNVGKILRREVRERFSA